MKRKWSILLGGVFLLAAFVTGAAPLTDDAFFRMDELPAELVGTVRPGHKIAFSMEENMTTGYSWSAVFEPRECRVLLKHSAGKSELCGAPGVAEVEIRPHVMTPCVVILNYARPFEKGEKPGKSVRCVVTANAQIEDVSPHGDGATSKSRTLHDDSFTDFLRLPEFFTVEPHPGMDVDFSLEELPSRGMLWSVVRYDKTLCRVRLKHLNGDPLLPKPRAEIEIRPLAKGRCQVELRCGGEGASEVKVLLLQCTFYGAAK